MASILGLDVGMRVTATIYNQGQTVYDITPLYQNTFNVPSALLGNSNPVHAAHAMKRLENLSLRAPIEQTQRIADAASRIYPEAIRVAGLFESVDMTTTVEVTRANAALISLIHNVFEELFEGYPEAAT